MASRYTEKSIQRHRNAGYSPKNDLRARTFYTMAEMNETEKGFMQMTKSVSERIDHERGMLEKMETGPVVVYLNEWLDACVVAMTGAIATFQKVLFPTRVEADKVAVGIMDMCKENTWKNIKDDVPALELQLSGYSHDVTYAAQDALGGLILVMEAYDKRRTAVTGALSRGRYDANEIVRRLREEDEDFRKMQEEAAAEKAAALAKAEEVNEEPAVDGAEQ
ncbi:MAG: hypothetical protein ACRDBQ_18570 [Shewanella sp.]